MTTAYYSRQASYERGYDDEGDDEGDDGHAPQAYCDYLATWKPTEQRWLNRHGSDDPGQWTLDPIGDTEPMTLDEWVEAEQEDAELGRAEATMEQRWADADDDNRRYEP